MRTWLLIPSVLLFCACTSKKGSTPAPDADPALFFKNQGTFCTVERGGQKLTDPIDRLEEIFVFGKDDSLKLFGLDLDATSRVQFNSKGEAKVKETEAATFRVNMNKLIFRINGTTDDREAIYKIADKCFELMPGQGSTLHCPCELPENN